MGQTASSENSGPQSHRRHEFQQLSRRIRDRRSVNIEIPVPSPPSQPSPRLTQRRSLPFATFSRQISAQSVPARDSSAHNGDSPAQDHIFYQQHEERPLVHMEDLGMGNGQITHITASPMPRRSRFSRLTSRIVSRQSADEAPASDQERDEQGHSLRRRLSERLAPRALDDRSATGSRRFSMLGSLARGPSMTARTRRRRELAPISRPFPLVLDGSTPTPHFITAATGERDVAESRIAGNDLSQHRLRQPSTRNSRFSRVRHSLSLPFENIRPLSRHLLPSYHGGQTPERPSRAVHPEDPNYLLPPLAVTDATLDLDHPVLQARNPHSGEPSARTSASTAQASEQMRNRAERGSNSAREARRMPNMLRGRSSRLIRRQDEGPLPRILHLAAVAIAAQLSGNPEQAITNLQAVGADGFDDSLNNLFRTLHEASDTMNTPQTANEPSDAATSFGSLPPLNFLRVFRFVNTNQDVASQDGARRSGGHNTVPSSIDEASSPPDEDMSNDADGRTVTLVVVGVRSVPSDHIGHEEGATTGPTLEALLNMPHPPAAPSNIFRGNGLRRSEGRSRLPRPRRASIGGTNSLGTNHGRQRPNRFGSSPHGSGISTPATAVSGVSDLPAGSHPPPSTPADYALSPYASGTTTPSRRPSSASALQQSPTNPQDPTSTSTDDPHSPAAEQHGTHPVHQRRRSESEFARHRNLGAGAARRNGVVAPDGVESNENVPSGSRSWLIYVVGTNISENHPALTTPSLFTDNPTYEDMLLLSSLLGPARPPVASREDVASAGGIYRVRKSAETLVAAALQGTEIIRVLPGERCLVCLCDYEVSEEIRRLTKCNHLFHRECIDQGVDEKNSSPTEQPDASSSLPMV
ncbi:MAG: hypothetical protein L6R37_003743 [Teloschistes peruensis]|nr:MAG: hypothetical protein L6R37_003743 [Teloschistes peruensis]